MQNQRVLRAADRREGSEKVRKKNPWIQKRNRTLGNFDFASTISLLLMGYGVYCLLNWATDLAKSFGTPKHG
jgi:hypothetical protein